MTRSSGRVRDRDVLALMALVVLVVLGADLLSGLVPALDSLLAAAPVLVLVLIAGTTLVLFRVARRSRDPVVPPTG